ncbi:MAG: hypothetical protein HC896_04095 [Bacteroidales bacterium]|nr:hypothetical protein [Bacteroidales bacterium]
MKNSIVKSIYFLLVLALVYSCEKKEDGTPKGLVTFSPQPSYNNDTITFGIELQFESTGSNVGIEYEIYQGATLLLLDTLPATIIDPGTNHFAKTPVVQIGAKQEKFAGKTLLIWLDPQNKLTASAYANEASVDLWKKEYLVIPEN